MRKDFRLPDLSFVSTDRLDMVQNKGIIGAPDLVVEVTIQRSRILDREKVEQSRLFPSIEIMHEEIFE